MKYLAAYMLLTLGGLVSPSAQDVKTVLSSVGAEVDSDRLDKLISELSGKDIQELIATGCSKLASVPSGGHSSDVKSNGAVTTSSTAVTETNQEPEKEEEESDEDMGFGLFD
ncbi:60S acidic ribosomal protein P2 [Trichophaea hybrida]|nr:60S acidic ribosomal protein P2 [Trichophaea hybrida]